MRLDMKMRKKIVSLGLALGLAFTAIPSWQMPLNVQAAGTAVGTDAAAKSGTETVTLESVRAEAAESYKSDKKAFDIDLSGQTFSGTGLDYSSDADGRSYMQVLENLKTCADDQTVIFRFKSTNANGLLFGAGTNDPANGKNMIFALKGGQFRVLLRNVKNDGSADTGLKGSFGSNLADGEWHTVAISFVPSRGFAADNVRMVVDSGTELYGNLGWGTTRKTGFNQNTDNYTKFEIGGGTYATADVCGSAALNGEIDFITVINKAYTAEELQKITSGDQKDSFDGMFENGTCRTWLFTGGTETVADFSTSGTTRNFVGLFEDNLRNDANSAGNPSFISRSRFVFNTGKRGADIASVLADYDTRIAPFGTSAVGIMVGASDYTKGEEGVSQFKETLRSLLDKLYSENKLPFIITPYPSADSGAAAQITAYVAAIREVAGRRTRIVDISSIDSGLVQADGSLSPAGHQVVANTIKTTLGLGGRTTSFNFSLQGGAYTVAKETSDGIKVTAGPDSIQVSVDDDSISGDTAQLTYVLTDTKGQEISGSAEESQTTFTVSGLKQGETYTLNVYDVSRGDVKESYHPVAVTVAEGQRGISREYEDGNVKVNEKIQSLFASEEPVTYLFMGDSITHGIVTQGYDNVPQLFAKYLDEMGRTEDIVLNTGVSNATIATTLDQIEHRLNQFDPDVVMVMLGTNDTSYNGENTVTNGAASTGGITVEQFKERYEQLVRKIYENNADTSIVLRIPCEMLVDAAHSGYEDKFDAIYDVADEMREEIPNLNIAVVNHRQEWLDYKDNVRNDNIAKGTAYGWLVDNVHPNGRGNMSMFQQIIKELGLYVNTSELANYEYALDAWTGTSDIAAPVTQRDARASFDMSALSGYTNGLKNVTLTLTADGQSISRTAEYSEDGRITLDGLDAEKDYTVKVTGKDAENSREITFGAALTKETNVTATDDEKKELTDRIAEAKALDVSVYPEEVRKAYKEAIQKIEDTCVKDTMTVAEVEEALAQVRLAKINLEKMAEAAEADRKAAKSELDNALAATEAKHQAGKAGWTEESWNVYDAAYRAAKAADDSTDAAALRQLLERLTAAEANLTVEASGGTGIPMQPQPQQPQPQQPQLQQPQSSQTIVEGQVYNAGNYRYKVTSNSNLTAEVVGIEKDSITKATVYNTVNLGGKNYKITSIGASAFKGNKKITAVSIGKNVQKIGKNAFAGCTKLKKVTVKGNGLKQMGSKTFYNCKALKSIVIKSKSLKSVGKNALKGISKKAVIKVPSAKLKAYTKLFAKKGQSGTVKIKK